MNSRLFTLFPFKINGYVLVFSLLVFALLIKLGLWQLERAQQKDLRLQKMQLYQQQAALNLNDVLDLSKESKGQRLDQEAINDLPVRLEGFFNNKKPFLLDNQVYKGSLGYRVIQVFYDELSQQSVLVNLGWIPGKVDRRFIPELDEITGQISFMGKIRIIESPIVLLDEPLKRDEWPQRMQSIDIDKVSRLIEQPLLPFLVYVDNDDALGYLKEWVPIVMSPDKHRGYAFQWFSLALAWLVLMLAAAYKASRKETISKPTST